MELRHYTDNPDFRPEPKFMSDSALSEFLSARPCLNADVVFYQAETKTMYLPTRKSRPADGLWVIGGALKVGEHPTDTLVRRVAKETGLTIGKKRFIPLGITSFVWSYRKEAPESAGRHDYNFVYALAVSTEELAQALLKLDPNEYVIEKGFIPFRSVAELKAAGAKANLIDYYELLFPGA